MIQYTIYNIVLYCIVMSENSTPTQKTASPSPAALDMMTRIIMSQTDMSHEEVILALERTNYDLKKVIREYMTSGSGSGSESGSGSGSSVSVNQLRFSEIRNFMDKSAETFRRNQEMTRIYQQVMEKKKQQQEQTAAAQEQQEHTAVSKL